jgi:hypothetical protein
VADGPRQRERSPMLDAAHQRRARLIDQIHRQAIAAANADRLAQQAADATRQSRLRKADGVIAAGIPKMIAVAAVIAALACVLVLWR